MNEKFNKFSAYLLIAAFSVSPLIFFTNITRNPYLIQERILQVFSAAALLMLCVAGCMRNKIRIPRTFLDRPLLAFFIAALLISIISFFRYPDFRWSILSYSGRRLLMFIFSGIVPFYVAAGMERKYLERLKVLIIVTGSISSLYAVMQFLHMDFIWPQVVDPYGSRSISTFGNPNFMSSFLLVVIFWNIAYIITGKRKLMWGLLLMVNIGGLGIAMTRSSLLGLFIGFAVLLVIMVLNVKEVYRQIKKYLIAVLAAVVLLFGLLSAVSDQFRNRVESMVRGSLMGDALTQRQLIWNSSAEMFLETPVIGRGWGNFEIFYPFYQGRIVETDRYRNLRTHANNAHNFLMELLTQTGIIGTGLYLWLIAAFFIFSIRALSLMEKNKRVWPVIMISSAAGFWVDNLLNVSLFFPMPAMVFWLNAGLLANINREYCPAPPLEIAPGRWRLFIGIAVTAAMAAVIYFNVVYFISASHFFKGFKFSRQKDYPAAREELEKAHKLYALNVDNNYELGNVYSVLSAVTGDREFIDKSIWAYREALRANPGYDEIYFNMAIMYLKAGRIKEGKANLEKALSINPLLDEAYRALGDVYAGEKDYTRAIELYEKAFTRLDRQPEMRNNLGYFYEVSGNIEKALENYMAALEQDSTFAGARSNFLRAYNRFKKSVSEKDIEPAFRKAERYIKGKKWGEALKAINGILSEDPYNIRALLYAGNIEVTLGRRSRALPYYRRVLLLDPNNSAVKSNLRMLENR